MEQKMRDQINLEFKHMNAFYIEEKTQFEWKDIVKNGYECICEYYNIHEITDKSGERIGYISLING
ncbi:MAG: hypothetical protein LBB45_08980 [Methanobrevibacter sp.]|jgi:hypothetical protein|nr:hypothetical protein [Candidatus Methanovirga basalitermitum]